jgi:ATP adenylyltransferase/5',5'''-P-1,P-4-tetraphosphate phosphorylase II
MEKIIREENPKSERGKKQPNPQRNLEMQQLNYNINSSHAIMGALYKFGIK